MRIDQDHITAFRQASQDHNPLHTDADYARRTPFGQPVVYGICGVVLALSAWADGRAIRLRSLRAVFRKPLFLGEEYRLSISEGPRTQLRIGRGEVDYAVIVLEADVLPELSGIPADQAQVERLEAGTWDQARLEARQSAYAADLSDAFWAAFGMPKGTLPASQLSTLLWSSYFVGMELPGRQALFAELDVQFAAVAPASAQLSLQLDAPSFDDRFNRVMQTGTGTGMERFRIVAFRRPEPVQLAVPAGLNRSWEGKHLFISGASRGFGGQLALVAGLSGARLALNYRRDAEGIAQVAELLSAQGLQEGRDFFLYQADMAQPEGAARTAAQIRSDLGHLDVLVNNAAPPIRDAGFFEQSTADFQRFVQMNLAIALESVRHLQPLLVPGGQVTHISTRYLVEPVGGFSHYLTAKHAQEGLMAALALELQDTQFVVARLPRILTDQTNLPFDLDPPVPALHVAERLLATCLDLPATGNHHVFNLWD